MRAVRAEKPRVRKIPENSKAARWKHEEIFDAGFLQVPNTFLELYANLKPIPLSAGEALFVLHLMTFKWTSSDPYPSYERLAKRMGLTTKAVRRYAQTLEAKNYLKRETRKGQTNKFDLSKLFDALLEAKQKAERAETKSFGEEVSEAVIKGRPETRTVKPRGVRI